MKKEIVYTLSYREEGEEKEIDIKIDFISNRAMKDFSSIFVLGDKANKAWNRVSDLESLIAAEKEDGYEKENEKIKEYALEIDDCYKVIMDFTENGYFIKRVELLQRILIDNGYKEDELLMSSDFWDDCVDPLDLLNFLTSAINKDNDKKKVQVKQ